VTGGNGVIAWRSALIYGIIFALAPLLFSFLIIFLKRKGVTAFATLHVAVARRVASESGPR
jgi:hypothetical protein